MVLTFSSFLCYTCASMSSCWCLRWQSFSVFPAGGWRWCDLLGNKWMISLWCQISPQILLLLESECTRYACCRQWALLRQKISGSSSSLYGSPEKNPNEPAVRILVYSDYALYNIWSKFYELFYYLLLICHGTFMSCCTLSNTLVKFVSPFKLDGSLITTIYVT